MTTDPRRSWALLAVGPATFMTYLDNNIVNVAIPAIQRDLHLTTANLEWVVSGYVLVFAGLLLTGYSLLTVAVLLIPGLLLVFLYPYAKRNFSDYLYYFVLDGLMMLSGLLMLILPI